MRQRNDAADDSVLKTRSQNLQAIIIGLPDCSNAIQGLLAQLVEQRTLNP
jgi:hypothetical protein